MPQKSELVRARVAPASKTRFEAVAAEHGLTSSEFLRQVIETVSGAADFPDQRPTKARREGKVTVRLGQEVAGPDFVFVAVGAQRDGTVHHAVGMGQAADAL